MKKRDKIDVLNPIKLAIVDDDTSYRTSLKDLLQGDPRIILYREYETGIDFIRDINSPFKPDVCLIDIKLGDVSGIECAKRMKDVNPNIPIIIMTAFPCVNTFSEARKIGADYIEKNSRAESLFKKIILSSKTSPEELIFSISQSKLSCEDLKLICQLEKAKKRYSTLSKCQIKILKLKKTGKSIKEISEILEVHPGTVGTQLSRAYEKLELPHMLDYI